jgi:hypothetical protein
MILNLCDRQNQMIFFESEWPTPVFDGRERGRFEADGHKEKDPSRLGRADDRTLSSSANLSIRIDGGQRIGGRSRCTGRNRGVGATAQWAMALPAGDRRQLKINKAIVEVTTLLDLSARIQDLAKTISTVERHSTPGQAQRLSFKDIAAGAVYRASELVRCPRSLQLVAAAAETAPQTVLRAARLLAKGGGGGSIDSNGRPINITTEKPGALAAAGDSIELLRCIGAINRVASQSTLATDAHVHMLRLTSTALAREIWSSGVLEGCMPHRRLSLLRRGLSPPTGCPWIWDRLHRLPMLLESRRARSAKH